MQKPERHGLLLLILLLFVWLLPLSIKTPGHLGLALLDLFAGHRKVHLRQFDKPGSGRAAVLPSRVVAMLDVLERSRITTFRLSAEIGADEKLSQRVIEGAYPRLISEDSPFLLLLETESAPPGCHELDRRQGVSLARCS